MPKSGEFYTFDEVLKQLHIDEQKLKRLVSEGEIRAFREGDEMKFKRSDIDTLDIRSEGKTREIDLGSAEDTSETLTDDLIFDEGDELDLSSDDAGMATAEISSQDTFVDEGGEPVGMSTEPLDFHDEGFEEEAEAAPAARQPVRKPAARPARVARYEEKRTSGVDVLMGVLLVMTALVLLFAGMTVYSAVSKNGANRLSGMSVKIFSSDDYPAIEKKFPAQD